MPSGAPQSPGSPLSPPAPLSRATWWTTLAWYFRPRPLAVAVEVAVVDGERVTLAPRFTLDGFTVPGALLAVPRGRPVAPLQTILGHRVRLDAAARGLIERIGGEPVAQPLAEAGPTLEGLATAGVPLTLRGTTETFVVGPALPRVSLALGPDESLAVASTLVAPDGSPVAKPVDLALLRAKGGWHADSRCLVRVRLSGTPLDKDSPVNGTSAPVFRLTSDS